MDLRRFEDSLRFASVTSLSTPPLFAALAPARHVLIAGAGGGFDIYAGLPLALALECEGKRVDLANLTFSELGWLAPERWAAPGLARIAPESEGSETYFPERTLARWLASEGHELDVYAIARAGVRPVRAAYRALHAELDALAARVRYAAAIAETERLREVAHAIGAYRERTPRQLWRTLPF